MAQSLSADMENLDNAYIGKNYEKLEKQMSSKGLSSFSWPAFLFGPSYFIARKIYLKGLCLLFLSIIFSALFFVVYFPYGLVSVIIAYHIALGFSFPRLYKKSIKKRIERIVSAASKKTPEEIRKTVEKKGGLGLAFPVIYLGIVSLFVWAFLFVFSLSSSLAGEWKGGGGYLVLNKDHSYYWYMADGRDDKNYYRGFYLQSHRAETAGRGFVKVQGILLFHQELVVEGQERPMNDYYARTTQFIIGKQSKDSMEVMNLKTTNRYTFQRVK